jgi:hypothetical protein
MRVRVQCRHVDMYVLDMYVLDIHVSDMHVMDMHVLIMHVLDMHVVLDMRSEFEQVPRQAVWCHQPPLPVLPTGWCSN